MDTPLEHALRTAGTQVEDLALAIAAEFHPVCPALADSRLDPLAADLAGIVTLAPQPRAEAFLDRLERRHGFVCELRGGPESLLLDRVLERRRGHPTALAIVYAALARRAGFCLRLVGSHRSVLLADASSTPMIAFDPAAAIRRPPTTLGWICSHGLAKLLLEALRHRLLEAGRLGEAIRAAELALMLPVVPQQREQLRQRVLALRAQLN